MRIMPHTVGSNLTDVLDSRDTRYAVPSETVSCQEHLWLISVAGTMGEAWLASHLYTDLNKPSWRLFITPTKTKTDRPGLHDISQQQYMYSWVR